MSEPILDTTPPADLIREALEVAQSGTPGRLVPGRSGTPTRGEALAYMETAIAPHASADLALVVTEPDAEGAQKLVAICGNGPDGFENARALAAAKGLLPVVLGMLADVWIGLEHIAQGEAYDPQALAAALVAGTPARRALDADLHILEEPTDLATEESVRRVEARRELTSAALRLYAAEQKHREHPYPPVALAGWQDAERELYAAAAAFLAAGGSEVEG